MRLQVIRPARRKVSGPWLGARVDPQAWFGLYLGRIAIDASWEHSFDHMTFRLLAADLLAFAHAGLMVFYVFGSLALGREVLRNEAVFRHHWTRDLHLAVVLFFALRLLTGWHSPLTIWEKAIRGDPPIGWEDPKCAACTARKAIHWLATLDRSSVGYTIAIAAVTGINVTLRQVRKGRSK